MLLLIADLCATGQRVAGGFLTGPGRASFVEVQVFTLGFFGQAAGVGFIHVVMYIVGVLQQLLGVFGAQFAYHSHERG